MHRTVTVHSDDTEIPDELKTSFLAAFTILLCRDCWAVLAFRPSTGNHYITPAAIQMHIENGIPTREPLLLDHVLRFSLRITFIFLTKILSKQCTRDCYFTA